MKIKGIKPTFNNIITTMDVYEEDVTSQAGLIDTKKQQGTVKEYQKVIAVGSCVRDINVGDLVCINPSRFAVKKYKEGEMKDGVIAHNAVVGYNFDTVEMDDKVCLLLQDRDISFVISEYEEIEEPEKTKIIVPQTNLIL